MKIIKTKIEDLYILEPRIFSDERGFFYESYNQKIFEDAIGSKINFVQDNHSSSEKGVLRGLHYQEEPHSQGKLVRCILGAVFDVAIDIRKKSATFGQWFGVHLSSENKRQLWIPSGFAHGFLVLSEKAEFVYKTTNYYHPGSDRGIIWNDPTLSINWPIEEHEPILSKKDSCQPTFKSIKF